MGEGYSYSRDLLQYNRAPYRPVVTGMYLKDSLTGAAVYNPEGLIQIVFTVFDRTVCMLVNTTHMNHYTGSYIILISIIQFNGENKRVT